MIIRTIQIIFTLISSFLTWFLGGFDGLMYALLVFVVADYCTGIILAICDKKVSSDIGFKGISRKILIFVLVGVANVMDVYIIKNGEVIRTVVIFFYISNEGISIIENSAALGLPIPEKLKNVLAEISTKNRGGKIGK